jgi:hypothetical protein
LILNNILLILFWHIVRQKARAALLINHIDV